MKRSTRSRDNLMQRSLLPACAAIALSLAAALPAVAQERSASRPTTRPAASDAEAARIAETVLRQARLNQRDEDSEAEEQASPEQIAAAVARVRPSLVRIQVVEPSYSSGREIKRVSSGSGAIISPEGYIITNHHVAGKAVNLLVTMPTREEVPARLVGTDAATDIAVIQLEPEEEGRTYPAVEFGDSDAVQVGDRVLAMGSPLGLSQSVTLGVISNTEMILPGGAMDYFTMDGEVVGQLVRWFGHDAAIFPGNSGGPLVNLEGEIIGINEIGIGLGGAIPGNLAKKVAEQIIEDGEVTRSYLGIGFQPLLKSQKDVEGILVSFVLDDSPAKEAGLEPGDIITRIAETPVTARFAEELPLINNLVADLTIGGETEVEVLRDRERKVLKMTPVQRQKASTEDKEFKQWGMTARDLTLYARLSMGRETTKGIMISSTGDGGPVGEAKPSLISGDIITKVGAKEIGSVEDLQEWTKENVPENGSRVPVIVEFEREGETMLTVVKVGIDPLDDPGREVRKAWLPVDTQVLTEDLAKQMKMPQERGVRVTRVYAEDEGFPIKVGDILTHIDGERINARQTFDQEVFNTMIRQYELDAEPEFTVLREGEKQTIVAKLEEDPERAREKKRYRDLELEFIVREATFFDKVKPELGGAEINVLVESVSNGGDADLAGLYSGDAVLAINDQDVKAVDDVQRIMEQIAEDKPAQVVFFVQRGNQNAFIEVLPSWEEE